MKVSNHPGSAGKIEFHISHERSEAPRSFWLSPGEEINVVTNIPNKDLIFTLNAPNISGRSLDSREIGVDDIREIESYLNQIWNITKSKEIRDLINQIEYHLSEARV